MDSIFVRQLKQSARERFEAAHNGTSVEQEKAKGIFATYADFVEYNNTFIALASVVLGAIGFVLMGYLAQVWLKNSSFYFGTFVDTVLGGIAVAIILWGVKSVVSYAVWHGMISKDYESDSVYPFLTLEGMSDIAYFIMVPFFIVVAILSTHLGVLMIGGAVFLKYGLLWLTYPLVVEQCTTGDKALLVASSIGSMVVLGVIIKMFVGA